MASVDPDRLGNILDRLLTERPIPKFELALDLVVHRARDTQAATVGESLHTRSDIDSVPIDPIGFNDDIADIDANAKEHLSRFVER